MLSKFPEPRKDKLIPVSEARKKFLNDHFVEDPDLSKHSIIIEHNLDIIESLQKLLKEVVEISSEGIEKESLEDKNHVFKRIRDIINQETRAD